MGLCPRNVMMVEKTEFGPQGDLVFIDFEGALFGRRRDDPAIMELDMFLGQYISLLLRWTKKNRAWNLLTGLIGIGHTLAQRRVRSYCENHHAGDTGKILLTRVGRLIRLICCVGRVLYFGESLTQTLYEEENMAIEY